MIGRRLIRCILALFGLLALAAGQALGVPRNEYPITDSFAPDYYYHDLVTRPFAGLVELYSHGRATVPLHAGDPRGSGVEMLRAIRSGEVAVGTLAPDAVPGRMPLLELAEYAGWNASTCGRTAALMRMTEPGGRIDRSDFEPNGLHRLLVFMYPDYPVIQTRDAATFAGRRIRTTTAGGDAAMRALGADPIRIADVGRIPEAVATGKVDGVLLPYRTVVSSGLAGSLHSPLVAPRFGSVLLTYAMSLERWHSLPQKIRSAFDRAGRVASETTCKSIDATMQAGAGAARQRGIGAAAVSLAREREIATLLERVRRGAAVSVSGGSETLREFDRIIRRSGR